MITKLKVGFEITFTTEIGGQTVIGERSVTCHVRADPAKQEEFLNKLTSLINQYDDEIPF